MTIDSLVMLNVAGYSKVEPRQLSVYSTFGTNLEYPANEIHAIHCCSIVYRYSNNTMNNMNLICGVF